MSMYGGNEAFADNSSQLQRAANPSDFFGEKSATKPQLSGVLPRGSDFWDGFQGQIRPHEFEEQALAAGEQTTEQQAQTARILKFPVQPYSIDGTPTKSPRPDFVPCPELPGEAKAAPASAPMPEATPQDQAPSAPESAPDQHKQRLPKLAGVTGEVHRRNFSVSTSNFQMPSWGAPALKIGVGAFLIWLVCAGLGSLFFGPPNVAGKWYICTQAEGKNNEGEIAIAQKGNEVYGAGTDTKGNFKIFGHVEGEKITFTKKYVAADGAMSKPISFTGAISKSPDDNTTPIIRGKWHAEWNLGRGWRRHIVNFAGKWTADFEDKLAADEVPDEVQLEDKSDSNGKSESAGPSDNQGLNSLAGMFVWGAVIFIAIGVGLFVASFALFGRGGIININEKRKYIPSQFKDEHLRIMSQLGQPLLAGGLPLGRRYEWRSWKIWETRDLALSPELRRRDAHMLVLGVAGKGKSRFLANMITHDITSNDRAIVLVDSDGGLADYVTRWVAAQPNGAEYASRVVIIDPTAREASQTYNPLSLPSDSDLQSASSSIVYGFKAMYKERTGQGQSQSQWNAQTAHILRNSALLLMVNNKSLADLPALLGDNDFRDFLLQSVAARKDERPEYLTLLETWNQYKKLARTEQWIPWVEPILNRATPMLGDPRIRHVLTSGASEVNLKTVIREKKILIVKLPQGQLETHADLVGSLVITGLKQAAQSIANERSGLPTPQVALYLDEFDRFIEIETIKSLAAESDRLGIGMIGAAKTLQDLQEDFRNQLLVSMGTIACFALAKKDADIMGPQMFRVDGRKIKHQTMQTFFNRVNAAPQFEFVSDEEKLNIDRLIGRDVGTFFCYRVGSVAGVFHLRSHDVRDIQHNEVNHALLRQMETNTCSVEAPAPPPAPIQGPAAPQPDQSVQNVFSMGA